MGDGLQQSQITRRMLLRGGAAAIGGALVAPLVPAWLARAGASPTQQAAANDALAAARKQMGAIPIQSTRLADNLTLLMGPGGNVVVLHGDDGKIAIDTFVEPAWDGLKAALDKLGTAPITAAVNTHWHFDHADNNSSFRKAGAAVIAHDNTKTRLTQSHTLLGMVFPAASPEALPTRTFASTHKLDANGEQVALGYIPPAHTDTDIYIRFAKADVLHLGDVFFNGMYPFIDASTGGSIGGMIAGSTMALKMAGGRTRIVPGHGPLGDAAALTRYRDMLVTVRDRVQKLKTAGRTVEQVVAANPLADLDATWGQGFLQAKDFLPIVYNTL
jgi:cyclase